MFRALFLALCLLLSLPRMMAAQNVPAPRVGDPPPEARLEPTLAKQLLSAPGSETIPIIVRVKTVVPLPEAPARVPDLQQAADASQAGIRSYLNAEKQAGRVSLVRPFWIFNGLAARAVPDTIRAIAQRPDVELVKLDRYEYRLGPGAIVEASRAAALPWGIERIGAQSVWSALGIDGRGVVVANMDTGVDFIHPALAPNYRGNLGRGMYQHLGNWFDGTDQVTAYPYDGHGHGTHTLGTIAGQAGIGVAPGAQWIAARVLDDRGFGYDSWIHAGFEWLLAPEGRPELAPDVVNNSWGSTVSNSTEFQADLRALAAAGILAVFSAGNSGPNSETIGAPAALPEAFSVGAIDPADKPASFSSRGPSPWNEVKPEIAAPGVNVLSALPGGAFGVGNGTSMAAPHVAGTAALILSAQPGLSITSTLYMITSTAVPLGAHQPNNDTGWGRLAALPAVQAAAGAGTLAGSVTDARSFLPLPGASITAGSSERTVTVQTGPDGRYAFGLATGQYSVTASLFGYQTTSVPLTTVITGEQRLLNFVLEPLPVGVVRGAITDLADPKPVTATISALGTPVQVDGVGRYEFALPAGTYTLQASGLGYRVVTATVTVPVGQVVEQDFALSGAPRMLLVNSGAWYYQDFLGYYRAALDELRYSYDEWEVVDRLTDVPDLDDLRPYDLVIWSAPTDSPGYLQAEETITRYLTLGKNLLLSGQDIAFWDASGLTWMGTTYLGDYLKTSFVGELDAGGRITGVPGSGFAGLSFDIRGGDGAGNQQLPDEIRASDAAHSRQLLGYGAGGSAGQGAECCLPYRAVLLPFGFEAIADRGSRTALLDRIITYLEDPGPNTGATLTAVSPGSQVGLPGTTLTYTVQLLNTGETGTTERFVAALVSEGWSASVAPQEITLEPCASARLTVTVAIPPGLPRESRNGVQLALQPDSWGPGPVISFTAKTPAPVLMVDDDRWYQVEQHYTGSLDRLGLPYDTWRVPWSGTPADMQGPSAERLSWYPLVLWFTGYDWYSPLSAIDEQRLGGYVDAGGSLLLSSAFYLDRGGDSDFARKQLGVLQYSFGITATHSIASAVHPAAALLPRVLLRNPFPRGSFSTLDAAMVASPDAAATWRGERGYPHGVGKQRDGAGRALFWSIPLEALPDPDRDRVLERAFGWLGALGDSRVEVSKPVVQPGEYVTATFVARNRGAPGEVWLRAPLPAGIQVQPGSAAGGLEYDAGLHELRWRGLLQTGQAATLTASLAVTGPGEWTARVGFGDGSLVPAFTQPLSLRAGLPELGASRLSLRAQENGLAEVEVVVHNSGAYAGGAGALLVAPLASQVLTGSVSLSGTGIVTVTETTVQWQGALGDGQEALLRLGVRFAPSASPTIQPFELLLSDGQNGAWEKRSELLAQPRRHYFPMLRR